MKVLIVRPFPSLLDVRQNTYNIQEVGLAKALSKRGCQVDLLFGRIRKKTMLQYPLTVERMSMCFTERP